MIRIAWERGSPLGMHSHNFPEIFWIEAGPCLHRINGGEQVIDTGTLVFIRPKDRHQFVALGRRRFIMVNLECHPGKMEELHARHPRPFAAWLNARGRMPLTLHLGPDRLQHLQRRALTFANEVADALHFEAFLFDLARLLEPPLPRLGGIARAPDWLQEALLEAKKPEFLLLGVAGLVRAAKRTPEHVARVCRATLNQTPTALIEQFRMAYAERELRLSARSVTEIALACGYGTTAQFHRAFRRHFSRTPLRYRRWLAGVEGTPA